MSIKNENDKIFLTRLQDDWIEDIESMSDAQIVEEFEAENRDVERVLIQAKGLHGRAMLLAAKTVVAAKNANSLMKPMTEPTTHSHEKLKAVLDQQSKAGVPLTLAARKGDGLSESDAASLLEDLQELGTPIEDEQTF